MSEEPKKKRGRPKGSKVSHPAGVVITVEQALAEGLPLPDDGQAKVAVKAGDLVFWVPPRVKSRAFPGILTSAAKFVASQVMEIPVGDGGKMQLDMAEIIRNECMAQFYSAIAANPSKKPRKKPRDWKKLASMGGNSKTPQQTEARRRNLELAKEANKKYWADRRLARAAKEAGLPPPELTPEVKNLLPLKK